MKGQVTILSAGVARNVKVQQHYCQLVCSECEGARNTVVSLYCSECEGARNITVSSCWSECEGARNTIVS